MTAHKKHPDELRARAVRRYREAESEPVSRRLADQFGIHPEALRAWIRQDQAGRGERVDQSTTDMLEENHRLCRENAQLKLANEVLRAASAYSRLSCFGSWASGPRPTTTGEPERRRRRRANSPTPIRSRRSVPRASSPATYGSPRVWLSCLRAEPYGHAEGSGAGDDRCEVDAELAGDQHERGAVDDERGGRTQRRGDGGSSLAAPFDDRRARALAVRLAAPPGVPSRIRNA